MGGGYGTGGQYMAQRGGRPRQYRERIGVGRAWEGRGGRRNSDMTNHHIGMPSGDMDTVSWLGPLGCL